MAAIQKQIWKHSKVEALHSSLMWIPARLILVLFLSRSWGNNGAVAVTPQSRVKWCDLLTVISQSIDRIRRGGTEIIVLMESETPVLPSPAAVFSGVLVSLSLSLLRFSARHLKAFSDSGVNTTQPYVVMDSKCSHAKKTYRMIVTWLKLLSYIYITLLSGPLNRMKKLYLLSLSLSSSLMLYKACSFVGLFKSVPGC